MSRSSLSPSSPSSASPAVALKAELRREALARRAALDEATREAAARRIAEAVDVVGAAAGTIVAAYLPIRGEVDPRPLMERLSAAGVRLALPVVGEDRETLIFRAWRIGDPLEPASFGLSVPPATAAEVEPTVLLIPLAAFDAAGHRIGYGKGHYDRALDRLERSVTRRKIGIAFSCQRVDAVPAEAHDRRLDLILTEDGPFTPVAAATE